MLIIFIRAIVLFTILLIVMRLMGKRQIGEMEPYELAITLVIAEIACVPMQDKSIPLAHGVMAILALYIVHQIIMFISKSNKVQRLISGVPSVVINKNGIDYSSLLSLNMAVSDLLQSMRVAGYFNIDEIKYGLYETNGQLSVVPNEELENQPKSLAVPFILDGAYNDDELKQYKVQKEFIDKILAKHHLKLKQVALLTIDRSNKMLIQPKNTKYFTEQLEKSIIND